jgi:hypothetical protein
MTLPKDPTKIADYKRRMSEAKQGKSLSPEHKAKISQSLKGKGCGESNPSKRPEVRAKMSAASKGKPKKPFSEEHKRKIGEAKTGAKHPLFGKHHTQESRHKMSAARKGKTFSVEHKSKLSLALAGDHNPMFGKRGESASNWRGGLSFAPYCPKFNEDLKVRVREHFGFKCVLCGKTEEENGEKLSVHHVNFEKMTCCNDVKPLFVSLCRLCHAKTNHNRENWEQYFTDLINEKFAGQCYLPKKEGIAPGTAI